LFLRRMERVFKSCKGRGRQEAMPPPPSR